MLPNIPCNLPWKAVKIDTQVKFSSDTLLGWRALHTADWHLGHTLNGWSRDEEHRVFFEDLAGLIEQHEIQLLIVAGDVFDTVNPSGEALRLFYRALAEFQRRSPGLQIVISGGNHDPAHRLEAPQDLLLALDVHILSTVHRQDGEIVIKDHLIPVIGADGDAIAYVLAIPFLRAADLTGLTFAADEDRGSPVVEAARRFFAEITEAADALAEGLPIIATSHLHCAGGVESEGAERHILIGGAHALPVDVFPPRLSYVALGHLHGPQYLDGGRVRYSGSCFPLSAAEIRYRHGVTLLTIEEDKVTTDHLPMSRPADVLRIPANGTLSIADLEAALIDLDLDPDLSMGLRPFVYVELEATDSAAVLMTEAGRILSRYPVRTAGLRVRRPEAVVAAPEPVLSLTETTPEALFGRAYLDLNGMDPEERHLMAFREALAGV